MSRRLRCREPAWETSAGRRGSPRPLSSTRPRRLLRGAGRSISYAAATPAATDAGAPPRAARIGSPPRARDAPRAAPPARARNVFRRGDGSRSSAFGRAARRGRGARAGADGGTARPGGGRGAAARRESARRAAARHAGARDVRARTLLALPLLEPVLAHGALGDAAVPLREQGASL